MKFRKLDDKTVCCMLSQEELTDNDITIEDFIHNKDKVQNFLEEIIDAAREEVGFEANGPMLSIQVMAAYPDGVMITFSEDAKDMASILKAGLAQMKGELEDAQWSPSVALSKGGEKQKAAQSEDETEKEQEKKSRKEELTTVFVFSDMNHLIRFAKYAPVRSGLDSVLYKSPEELFYLGLMKRRMSDERYRAVVSTAMEFGKFSGATSLQMAFMEEHYDCMIPDKAVNVLKKIAGD